ncbi:MAG: outer membrane beta-barrel protein [Nitrospiraceae bacterium]|nr:outer membrane beta-barrel protein [Nitrospiraceae bacterium]
MKKVLVVLTLLALAVFTHTGVSLADSSLSAGDIKNAIGMSIYLQGGFTGNLQGNDTNDWRVFDNHGNQFTLDLAELQFLKAPAVGQVGYKVKLSAGETAKDIHSVGLGASNPDQPFDLTEAYVNYTLPVGSGLTLQLGKFVTFTGEEVIEASGDYNYSRSFLFNYAIPFTHTGFMAGYTFSPVVSANAYILNGWDVASGNNHSQTYGLSTTVTPSSASSLAFNFLYGPTEAGDNHDNRFLFDWVGSISPVKNLTLVANTDYGWEKGSPSNPNLLNKDAKWYGAAVYANYVFSPKVSGTIRAEEMKDPQGFRTGVAQNLKEVTLTGQYTLANNLLLRPEYRHDWSNQATFNNSKKSQDTLALGVMYTW